MGEEIATSPVIWKNPVRVDHSKLGLFLSKHPEAVIIDNVDYALSELFDINNPHKKDTKTEKDVQQFIREYLDGNKEEWGEWFLFPWNNYLVHFPPQKELRQLRASRNQNLITEEEQKKLYKSTILIAGMSVGSNVVEALLSSGIGGKLILADMDIIEPTNLNRIRAPFYDVGVHKIDSIAKKISEVDPYIEQIHLREGLNQKNLEESIKKHKPSVLIDEVDSLNIKVLLRQSAQKEKIPVIMATDNGEGFILDVERYDIESIDLFCGRVPSSIIQRVLTGEKIPRHELGKVIGEYFVGLDNISTRMLGSLKLVGKTLPSWPQLGSSAAMGGIYAACYARYIILGGTMNSFRIYQSPEVNN